MRRILWTFAILWLIVAGILMVTTGAAMAWQEVTRTDSCIGIGCGLRQLFAILDLVGIAFGLAYAVAGIGLWRGRPRARPAGLLLTVVGFVLVPLYLGIFLPTLLGWAMSETAYVGLPDWPGIATLTANGVAFVGLLIRSPASRGSSATDCVTSVP
jgi:hypothetical protein